MEFLKTTTPTVRAIYSEGHRLAPTPRISSPPLKSQPHALEGTVSYLPWKTLRTLCVSSRQRVQNKHPPEVEGRERGSAVPSGLVLKMNGERVRFPPAKRDRSSP